MRFAMEKVASCHLSNNTNYNHRMMMTVLQKYGGKCVCCGETYYKFLSLDHVNGGGAAHLKKEGNRAHYKDAIDRDFPIDYQVLCHNCNKAKGVSTSCPCGTRQTIQEYLETLPLKHKFLTEENKEKVMSLREQGLSFRAIGAKLGVSYGTIAYWCKRISTDEEGFRPRVRHPLRLDGR